MLCNLSWKELWKFIVFWSSCRGAEGFWLAKTDSIDSFKVGLTVFSLKSKFASRDTKGGTTDSSKLDSTYSESFSILTLPWTALISILGSIIWISSQSY